MSTTHFRRQAPAERRAGLALVCAFSFLLGAGCSAPDDPVGGGACSSDADCQWLDNGDRCDGGYACVSGACAFDASTVVTCDTSADTACRASTCAPADGTCALAPRNDGAPCEDGEPCTLGDVCAAGACVSGKVDACECTETADCADDGDLCNGAPLCDTSSFPYRCVTNPATVVTCKDDGDPCTVESCAPKTGTCASAPAAEGATCDDGDPCTAGDVCTQGGCKGPTQTCGCQTDSDCPDLDGDPCNGTRYCDLAAGKGTCKLNPATVVTCSSKADTACLKNTCSKLTGACALTPAAEDTACDDGDACTTGEVCVGGTCAAGTDICTCSSDKDCVGQGGGDLCKGVPFCNKASGKCEINPATQVVCLTVGDTACAKNVCVPKTGKCTVLPRAAVKVAGCVDVDLGGGVKGTQCLWLPADATSTGSFACDDGNACTVGDQCVGATCTPGKTTCECTTDAQCALKDDGDACNGVDVCDTNVGQCVPNPASVVYCDKSKDSACLKAACDPKTGSCSLKPQKTGQKCDDGAPCTSADACTAAGACVGAKATVCDDQDACTVDVCKAGVGCAHTPKSCADGNACTLDGCDPKTGACKSGLVAKGKSCNGDSDGCTVGDACDGKGTCVTGSPAICAGKTGACEQNACQSKGVDGFSCAVVKVADKTPCADDDACFVGATCQGGSCKAGQTQTLFTIAPKSTGTLVFEAGVLSSAAAPKAAGDGAGVAILAGTRTSGAKAGTWRVLAVDRAQKTLWDIDIAPPAGIAKLTHVVQVLDRAKLGVVVVGRGETIGGVPQAVSTTVALNGVAAKAVRHTVGPPNTPFVALKAALHPSGNLAIAGTVKATTLAVALRSVTGVEVWTYGAGSQIEFREVNWLDCAPDGTTTLATTLGFPGSKLRPYYLFMQLDPAGQERWTLSQGAPSLDMTVVGMMRHPGQPLRALLRTQVSGQTTMSWFRLDPSDGAAIEPDVPWTGTSLVSRLSERPAGSVWLGDAVQGAAQLGATDLLGNRLWRRALPTDFQASDLTTSAQRVLVWGSTKTGAPMALVVDRWGFTSCNARGACADKVDCSDGDACTSDGCDPVTGCTHAPQLLNVCTPGQPCTPYGACGTGSCVAQHNGRVFVSGRRFHSGSDEKAAGMTVNSQGNPVYWTHYGPTQDEPAQVAPGTVGVDSGKVADTGNTVAPGMTQGARVVQRGKVMLLAGALPDAKPPALALRVFAEGDTGPSTPFATVTDGACPSCTLQLTGVTPAADAGTYLFGFSSQFGGKGLVFRVSPQGKPSWVRALGAGGAPGLIHGGVGRADGGVVYAGLRVSAGVQRPVVGWVSPTNTGAGVAEDTLATQGAYHAAAERADLSMLAVGTVKVGSVNAHLAGAYSTGGKLLWRKQATLADGVSFNNVVATSDGGAVVAGARVSAGVSAVRVERWTAGGAVLWSRTQLREGEDPLVPVDNTLASVKGGGYVLAAVMGFGDVTGYGVIRTDASGHMSCQSAGVCATLAPSPCDDSNPCTADWCDPKSKCQHGKLTGAACGVGGTCSAGVCKNP